jgi:hypothetical protein
MGRLNDDRRLEWLRNCPSKMHRGPADLCDDLQKYVQISRFYGVYKINSQASSRSLFMVGKHPVQIVSVRRARN